MYASLSPNQFSFGGGGAFGSRCDSRTRSSTSWETSASNGNAAAFERPMCVGSGSAAITPVTTASTVFWILSVRPTASALPHKRVARSSVTTALRGFASAPRASPATNGSAKISRKSESTATALRRTV